VIFKISIAKMGGVIASLVSALALASPAQAIGLTFNWSFNATENFGTPAQLGVVSGTLSGVQDNATTSSGLIATVLTTPDGQNQGLTFNLVTTGGGITVAGGVVTLSTLGFGGSNLSGSDFLDLQLAFAEYFINSPIYDLANYNQSLVTFSSATPVPFDFDPSFGVVALGGIWAGRKVIKKIAASKKSV
jgi:hypothetical protein